MNLTLKSTQFYGGACPRTPLEGQRLLLKYLVRKTGIANAIGELYFTLSSYFISLIRWHWWV